MTDSERLELAAHMAIVHAQRVTGAAFILASIGVWCWRGIGAALLCAALGWFIASKIPAPSQTLDKVTGRI